MQKLPTNCLTPQPKQWQSIHTHLKTNSSYKSIYSQTNTYISKISNLLTQTSYPLALMQRYQHQGLLSHLRLTYTKIINQIQMLDLGQLALCVEFVFGKLLDCLQLYYTQLVMIANKLNQQTSLNKQSWLSKNQCQQCKTNITKNNINTIKTTMTLTQHTQFPFFDKKKRSQELQHMQHDYLYNYQNIQLTLMIDEILSKKDTILGTKTNKNSNVYEEIVEYLESIPQNTVNLSKENNMNMSSVVGKIHDVTIGNFNQEFDKNFGEMLKNPIKNLIKRILQYAKNLYYKPKKYETASTQTLMIKDEQNIKMLLKNIQNLKKQLQFAKKSKRQAQQDMVRLMDSQQINQLKISQISKENIYLKQKLQRNSIQLNELKLKIDQIQQLKKQKQQKTMKQHLNQRTMFIKSIKQLQIKIEATSNQLLRLRKQTQGSMVSQYTMTQSFENSNNQVQVDQKGGESQNWSLNTSMNGNLNRNSMGNQSKKNYMSKFANINRKSVNNNPNNTNPNNNPSQNNQADTIKQNNIEDISFCSINNSNGKIQNKNKKVQPPINMNTITNTTPTQTITKITKPKPKPEVKENYESQLHINPVENKKVGNKRNNFRQQSIVEKIALLQQENDKQNYQERNLQINRNDGSTIQNLAQEGLSHFKSEQSLRLQGIYSTYKNQGLFSRNSDSRHVSPSGNFIRSRRKLQSSRMFNTKTNCSPYIGGGCVGTSIFNQGVWLDMLQINNVKRQSHLKNQTEKERENIEKLQFVSRLMKKYSQLKSCGLLSKINQIVSVGQLEDAGEIPLDINIKDKVKENQCDESNRKTVKDRKLVTDKKFRSKNILGSNIKRDKQIPTSLNVSKRQLDIFGQNEAILLFGSLQYAKKYELHIEVWSSLENSIMLDYNFMTLCDNIEIFLASLQKNQPAFYLECSQFIQRPVFYLQSRHESSPSLNKTQTSNRKNHLRNFSSTMKPNFLQNEQQTSYTPHKLRNTLHKILRFHKIVHKKCNHVKEFLAIIGFDNHSNVNSIHCK